MKSQPARESHCAEKPAAIISGQSQAEGIAKFASKVTYDDLTPERRERLKISILIPWRAPSMWSEHRRSRRAWLRPRSSAGRTGAVR